MNDRLTQSDIDKMQKEIEHRKLVLRKQLLEDVKETRAHGDLSENFEYYAAKREKNRNESRIRYLDRMIRTANIISEESAEDEVGIGDEVTLHFEEDDYEDVFCLVTTMGADSLNNKISIESPIGRAIRGQKVNARRKVVAGNGEEFYITITKIDKGGK